MAFTRQFLKQLAKESGVELPREMEDSLINEHTTSRDAYVETKIKPLEEQLEKQQKQDINIKETEEYKALQNELETFKTSVESKKMNATKIETLSKKLEEAGANKTAIKLLLKEFDLTKVEIENGEIKDVDNLIKPVQESYKDFFGQKQTSGVKSVKPPTGGETDTTPKSLQEALKEKYNS